MRDYRHRCTTAECPYLGQLTDNLSCGCHRKEAEIMREKLALLTAPRPIEEYHEDMGVVLWWAWEKPRPFKQISERVVDSGHNGQWKGEPPYVGTPNDLGFTVEVIIRSSDNPTSDVKVRDVGGWPGYHTHFTPLPPMPEVPK